MELSVVIPAYNEADRIEHTLSEIFRFLEKRGGDFEVIVVDDGSRDSTVSKVESFSDTDSLRLVSLASNQGKGAAVRRGMSEAAGDYMLMTDADLSTPIQDLEKLLPLVKEGYEVAAGSRQIQGAAVIRRQRLDRQIAGLAFGGFTRHIVPTGVIDTQCGFKCFQGHAAKTLFSLTRVNGYCFDIELLAIARLLGMKVIEVAVRWENREGSKVSMIKDLPGVVREILEIKRNLSKGVYQSESSY